MTSYPDYFFGNIFREPDLTRMLDSKDPYCEVYKTIFARAEKVGQERRRPASAPAMR